MANFQDLADASYVSIESFRRDGTGVKSPVWITSENGKHYAWTVADSWKVKRIRNNPQVNLAICDARGNIKSEWVSANAKILDDAQSNQVQIKRMAQKYGLFFRFIQMMSMLRRTQYVVIELSPQT